MFGFIKWIDRYEYEVTALNQFFAVRRVQKRFNKVKNIKYLNLQRGRISWLDRSNGDFNECLSTSHEHAVGRMITAGLIDLPAVGSASPVTLMDLVDMLRLSETDVGQRDLLLTAKEWLILKGKAQS